jgi:hypothetical protein
LGIAEFCIGPAAHLTIMEFMSQLGVFWQVSSNTAIPSSPGIPLAASSSPHFAQNGFITDLQPLEHWSVAVGYPPEHPAVPARKSPGSAFCAGPQKTFSALCAPFHGYDMNPNR